MLVSTPTTVRHQCSRSVDSAHTTASDSIAHHPHCRVVVGSIQAGSCSMDFCSLFDSVRAMSIFRGFARSASGIVTDRTPLS